MTLSTSTTASFMLDAYNCLVTTLQASTSPPKHIVMRPGIIVEPDMAALGDQCCAGYAHIRLISERAPQEPTRTHPLGTPISAAGEFALGVEVEIAILRCAPVADVNFGVTDAAWNTHFSTMMADRDLLWKTVCCVRSLFSSRHQELSIIFNTGAPLEVSGACMGYQMQFTAEIECPDGVCP